MLFLIFGIFGAFFFFSIPANAETNISATSTEHFAWDDIDGWWDFYLTNTAYVWGSKIDGYASSTVGEISLN